MQETGVSTTRRQWTTEDVEPRHALAYWVDTICRSFLEIDIESPQPTGFSARLESSDFADGSLYLVQAGSQNVRRTSARIARSQGAWTFLMQIRSGQQVFRQYGRECRLGAGDCVVVDCNEPYQLDCLGPTRSVVLRLPHEWLTRWVPTVESAAARVFRGGEGWSGALSAAVGSLDDGADLALPTGTVADQLGSLVALAVGPEARATRPADRLYRQLQARLREGLDDAALTPAALAAAQGISLRYLHHLFAGAGTTFGAELVRLRLDAARRLLEDRRWSALGIAEVAARCGFADPSHFARRFRQAYGLAPQDHRRRSVS
ncbi:MAG: AraC family transcriptional regulator [Steroidobacteraceae bacterium]